MSVDESNDLPPAQRNPLRGRFFLPGDPAAEAQSRQNRSTRGQWAMFASHRAALERLLTGDPPTPNRTLAVLGAGNCNDLDLAHLKNRFSAIELFDIDPSAPAGAVRRQGVENTPSIRIHAPVDLTGVSEAISDWKVRTPNDADIASVIRDLHRAPIPDLGRFSVVLSPCVLTQLLYPAVESIPKGHMLLPELRSALRQRHLRLLSYMLEPAGRAILAIDIVSSKTIPDLASCEESRLSDLMQRAIQSRRYFGGVDPDSIVRDLRSGRFKNVSLENIQVTSPWLWHLGLRKSFLVYAVCFRRRDSI